MCDSNEEEPKKIDLQNENLDDIVGIISYKDIAFIDKKKDFKLEKYMRMNGADSLAFDTIVASGPNSSMPHAIPSARRIREGDMILLDFGCKYKGYCSDMTRTIFVSFIDDDVKEAYEFVKELQENIFK